MRVGAKIDRARKLRADQTEVEKRLWSKLRDRQLVGYKFRRQVPVGPLIADFACIECRLFIELDGGQHDAMFRQGANRTALLEGRVGA